MNNVLGYFDNAGKSHVYCNWLLCGLFIILFSGQKDVEKR